MKNAIINMSGKNIQNIYRVKGGVVMETLNNIRTDYSKLSVKLHPDCSACSWRNLVLLQNRIYSGPRFRERACEEHSEPFLEKGRSGKRTE